jgi:hypothetical protein
MRGLVKTVLLIFAALSLTACEKYALDRQMEELCKKDGGVKIYEKVTLPAKDFDSFGEPLGKYRMTARSREESYGPDYKFTVTETVLKDGDPIKGQGRLMRYEHKLYRRADNKLLAVEILYARSGGDFIAFPHRE